MATVQSEIKEFIQLKTILIMLKYILLITIK